MKTSFTRLALATLTIVAANASSVSGSEVATATIDGGGGASSGGNFSIAGTIGQPDAGILAGGSYALEGGFWGRTIPVKEDAPRLSIAQSGSEILVSWPRPATGFLLEWSRTLTATSVWNSAGYRYATSSTHISHSEPVSAGTRLYRLTR